ncbi:MAG: GC-type dockerin domain-anchored protein [Phycisphaerales bacterium]|nr:GC-type dockerin domain-anchored protein [Phycisphaerales bacterium]
MNLIKPAALATLIAASTHAQADHVLIVSAGSTTTDSAMVDALISQGHTAEIGPNYWEFDAAFDLSTFDVVYIQGNGNWTQSDIPIDAQSELLDFAQAGGGIIFSEWVVWMVQARGVLQVLAASMPIEPSASFRTSPTISMTLNTSDPIVSAGLPANFTMPVTSFSGTETFLAPRENATVFFDSDFSLGGETSGAVVGWDICGGRVVNLSTTVGVDQINDPNFRILIGNLVTWVTRSVEDNSCPVDIAAPCGALNFFDVSLFLSRFSAMDSSADLNNDGALNFFDISTFLSIYSGGCP